MSIFARRLAAGSGNSRSYTFQAQLGSAMRNFAKALIFAVGLAAASPALAQSPAPPPPVRTFVDANGVDLLSGSLVSSQTLLSIGADDNGQRLTETFIGAAALDNMTGGVNYDWLGYRVSLGDQSELFGGAAPTYYSMEPKGSTLTSDATTFTYTGRDGTIATFTKSLSSDYPRQANQARLKKIVKPSGEEITYTYYSYSICIASGQGCTNYPAHGLLSVVSTLGYQINLPWESSPTATNNALSGTVNKRGGLRTYTSTGASNITVNHPSGRTLVYTRNGAMRVTSMTNGSVSWTYAYSESGDLRTVTVTDPLGHSRVVVSSIANSRVVSDTNGAGQTTSFQYDASGRLERVTAPEGNYTHYIYDARGNVLTRREVSKTPGTPADIVLTANYDAVCANPKTCNKPNWVDDPRLGRSNYTYDPAHGGVLTATAPAGQNGVRPQTRYSYASLYAWYNNSAGALSQAPTPVWKLVGTSSCRLGSAPACVGTADEAKTTISYGATGVPNNLLPTSIVKSTGDGAVTLAEAFSYDAAGNLRSVDGPTSGTGDTEYSFYDSSARLVGKIGPDPDGAGPLLRPASRFGYHADGLLNSSEAGTTSSTTTVDGMSVLEAVTTTVDSLGRKATDRLRVASQDFQLTQYSYNSVNKVVCTAVRMNPAVYGSLPASACSLGTQGSDGPDWITLTEYDLADRVTKVSGGYQVDASVMEERAYTNNGQVDWVRDGENNLTNYVYDGFDRLKKVEYPVSAKGQSAANTANAGSETYDYDASGNLTSIRPRGADVITLAYDGLDRLISKSLPYAEYGYDNHGNQTSAIEQGRTIARVYDAIGRLKSETGPIGQVSYSYDASGRRDRLIWPDGFFVSYEYDATDRAQAIRRNGSLSTGDLIAAYTYDSQGRRASLSRGNGVTTSYEYDEASNLKTLSHNLPGTADDVTFGLRSSPSGQLTNRSLSNLAYSWSGRVTVDRSFETGGDNRLLNSRLTGSAIDTTYVHDTHGNLTSDGVRTYGYDIDDRLTSSGSGAALAYDPLGRLYETKTSAQVATRYLYDGLDLIAEYDGSNNLLRRYAHGPGSDEPLAWFDTDVPVRWLLADTQGSIIASTNASGAIPVDGAGKKEINTYDEYGLPGASNKGRFQFTGQTWLADVSLYHYKARVYSPTLGRFLQTDPIGYEDGLNWYAYVGNDPLNDGDPLGLCTSTYAPYGNAPGDNGVTGGPACPVDNPFAQYQNAYWQNFQGFVNSGGVQLALEMTIPGYDLFKCTEATCTDGNGNFNAAGRDALIGLLPAGKLLKVGKLGKAAAKAAGKVCNCFVAGTLVAVEGGFKPIEEVRVGDRVLSRNDATGETAFKPVAGLIPGGDRTIWDVTVEVEGPAQASRRETIHTTEEHPFRTTSGHWVLAANLKAGFYVQTASGAPVRVIEVVAANRMEPTFNLEVEGFHTYFVGRERVWVHNACKLGPSGKPMRHFPQFPSRKRAEDAARSASAKGQTPMEHSNPRVGDPHFHPVGPGGKKLPGSHYGY